MRTIPLLQQALGDEWQQLPAVIQRHYQLDNVLQSKSIVTGSMQIRYPACLKPIMLLARLLGALVAVRGADLQVTVRKWVTPSSDVLYWKRFIKTPNGKTTIFASRMQCVQAKQVIEYVGFGFGIRLRLSVENGCLVYRSIEHLWQTPWCTIPIADILFLGHAVIIETALSDREFKLDFTIRHPLWGETYFYGGVFSYA